MTLLTIFTFLFLRWRDGYNYTKAALFATPYISIVTDFLCSTAVYVISLKYSCTGCSHRGNRGFVVVVYRSTSSCTTLGCWCSYLVVGWPCLTILNNYGGCSNACMSASSSTFVHFINPTKVYNATIKYLGRKSKHKSILHQYRVLHFRRVSNNKSC